MGSTWLRASAVVIASLAAIFWLWFGAASAATERLGVANWVLHILLPGGVLILSLLIALLWEGVGGTLLTLEGLLLIVYPALTRTTLPNQTVLFLLLTLGLPHLLAGILFLLDHQRSGRIPA